MSISSLPKKPHRNNAVDDPHLDVLKEGHLPTTFALACFQALATCDPSEDQLDCLGKVFEEFLAAHHTIHH